MTLEIKPYVERPVSAPDKPSKKPRDRYQLLSMEVGESGRKFWYGKTQQEISPYCTYFKKRGLGVWKLEKGEKDGRSGVYVVRINTPMKGAEKNHE